MSEAVQIALIQSLTFIVGIIVSRWLSHVEHKKNYKETQQTAIDVKEIKRLVNGKKPE